MTTTATSPVSELSGDREHTIELPAGRTLSYVALGAEEGPTVVVLDGPGSRGLARAAHAAASRIGVRLIAPDRPGYGHSTPAPKRTIVSWAQDMEALADALELERFGLLGQSGGTPYALITAQRLAPRVSAVSLTGGIVPLGEPGALTDVAGPMLPVFRMARRAPWLLKPIIGMGARQSLRDVDKAGARFVKDAPAGDKAELEDPVMWAIHVQAIRDAMAHPAEFALEARMLAQPWGFDISETRVPVSLWVGEGDVTHPESMARKLAERIGPNTPVHVVPNAGTFGLRAIFEHVLRFCAPTGS